MGLGGSQGVSEAQGGKLLPEAPPPEHLARPGTWRHLGSLVQSMHRAPSGGLRAGLPCLQSRGDGMGQPALGGCGALLNHRGFAPCRGGVGQEILELPPTPSLPCRLDYAAVVCPLEGSAARRLAEARLAGLGGEGRQH